MIKATGIKDGNPLLFFGITEGNIELLKQGKPIVVNLADMGGSGEVVITYGQTEAHIIEDMQNAGILPGQEMGSQN